MKSVVWTRWDIEGSWNDWRSTDLPGFLGKGALGARYYQDVIRFSQAVIAAREVLVEYNVWVGNKLRGFIFVIDAKKVAKAEKAAS